ncbi:MAG: DUF2807 domain-containing protein, partial [Bacteroidia bacterium]|nr:DUF2807 domain-containing protein [Bacteroidia bacterium]
MNTLTTKIIGTTILASFFALNLNAQQTRTTEDFHSLKVGDSFNVKITQSENNSITIDAPENVLTQIKTEVSNGILKIESDGNIKTDKNINILIGVKALESIDVTGAADIKSSNQLQCTKLKIESSGAGDLNIDVKANEIITQISGAGDITLKGITNSLNAKVSGAGALKAANLEAENATVSVSGAGDAKVNVKQQLNATVSGAGSIIYKGNPTDRNIDISGAGSVRESKSGTGEETASDTTKIKLGGKKYTIIGDDDKEASKKYSKKDSIKNHNNKYENWAGWELGVNGLMNYDNTIDMNANAQFLELNYSKSYQFGLNLGQKNFHIYKNYINIVTGIGFDFNHYAFKNNTTLNHNADYLSASTDSISYKKNSLNVSYLKAPLLLEINTSKNPKKNFH